MRRFLVSFQYSKKGLSGFGSLYHDRPDGTLPTAEAIVRLRREAAAAYGPYEDRSRITVIAISEVSPDGPAVI